MKRTYSLGLFLGTIVLAAKFQLACLYEDKSADDDDFESVSQALSGTPSATTPYPTSSGSGSAYPYPTAPYPTTSGSGSGSATPPPPPPPTSSGSGSGSATPPPPAPPLTVQTSTDPSIGQGQFGVLHSKASCGCPAPMDSLLGCDPMTPTTNFTTLPSGGRKSVMTSLGQADIPLAPCVANVGGQRGVVLVNDDADNMVIVPASGSDMPGTGVASGSQLTASYSLRTLHSTALPPTPDSAYAWGGAATGLGALSFKFNTYYTRTFDPLSRLVGENAVGLSDPFGAAKNASNLYYNTPDKVFRVDVNGVRYPANFRPDVQQVTGTNTWAVVPDSPVRWNTALPVGARIRVCTSGLAIYCKMPTPPASVTYYESAGLFSQ